MISEDALGDTGLHQMLDEFADGNTVRSAIDQVADKNQGAIGPAPGSVHPKFHEKPLQRFNFPVDVSDQVHAI
jgi:hypothetical protein